MNTEQLMEVADGADVIVNGYAMTLDGGMLRVINLHRPTSSAVFDRTGRLTETTMDDIELSIVQNYVDSSKKYLEESLA